MLFVRELDFVQCSMGRGRMACPRMQMDLRLRLPRLGVRHRRLERTGPRHDLARASSFEETREAARVRGLEREFRSAEAWRYSSEDFMGLCVLVHCILSFAWRGAGGENLSLGYWWPLIRRRVISNPYISLEEFKAFILS